VTGVPDQRDDHAVQMARFAMECVKRFSKLTKQLVVMLGPSTANLQARVGLHSGPVTGGVSAGAYNFTYELFVQRLTTECVFLLRYCEVKSPAFNSLAIP
jgi:class 3 adenylate cyclase